MEKSIDKRLEALKILTNQITIAKKTDVGSTGQAIAYLDDGLGNVCEIFVSNYEAELLERVFKQ